MGHLSTAKEPISNPIIYLVLKRHQLSMLLGVHLMDIINTVVMCNYVLHNLLLSYKQHVENINYFFYVHIPLNTLKIIIFRF